MPAMLEPIAFTTPCNTVEKRNPQKVILTGVNGSSLAASDSGTSDVVICLSPTPPYICSCNDSIGNIGHSKTVSLSIASLGV